MDSNTDKMSTDFKYRRKIGDRYGLLELLECLGTDGKHKSWRVKCHGCGKEYIKKSIQLREKRNQSCGCNVKRQNNESPHWRGVGDLSSAIFTRFRTNAKRRGIPFDLHISYVWDLYILQDKKCAISGLPIVFGRTGRDENTASLDRKDSKLPYIKGNVQWVRKHINMMKLDHPQDYFINLCSLISFNQNQI